MLGMGRLYTVSFAPTTVATASGDVDFFEFTPADDKPILLEGLYVKQTTEVADAQEEQIAWSIVRGHTTSGSGGSAPTPVPTIAGDAAAGFTAEVLNTTVASTAGTTVHNDAFNVRVGLEYVPPPEARINATQAHTTLVVRMLSTVADAIDFTGTAYVRELG